MTCSVCCETYNLSSRKKINCPYCPYDVCASCSERYLVSSTEHPHCMNCKKEWSRDILLSNFTKKFVTKDYKLHRENVLFEKERSLLPETQPHVEREKKLRRYNALMTDLKNQMTQIGMCINHIFNNPEVPSSIVRSQNAMEKRKEMACLEVEMRHYELCYAITFNRQADTKKTFVRACPADGCRGFLSTAWKCGLCEKWSCPECHEVKGVDKNAPHICKPECVETARLLAKDSKTCPKCAALIFKIDGCDQMFCTQCTTAFSWRTGNIEAGRIHNPHYYQYLQAHGQLRREPGDVPCGGMPGAGLISRLQLDNKPVYAKDEINVLATVHRLHGHNEFVILPRFAENVDDNRDLRIRYMIGDFDDENFKRRLQQREKAREKKRDIRSVIDMYQAVVLDIFQKIANDPRTNYISELYAIRQHVNDMFEMTSKTWGCARHMILPNWHFA